MQTLRGPWDFAMHPYPGRCRLPCFMVTISCREVKAVQYTAERLKKSLSNRRGGRNKNAVTAVVSLNRSAQTCRTRVGIASQINPEIEVSGNPSGRKF